MKPQFNPAQSLVFAVALGLLATKLFAAEPLITAEELALVKQAEAARIRTIDKAFPSVVAVFGMDPKAGGGSGVLIHPSGLAVTNHHVIAGPGKKGMAGLPDGKLYPWKLIGTDPGGDVAVIQLQGRTDFPVSPLGDSNLVRVGETALAMGNPFTLAEKYRPTVTAGIVSGVHRYQYGSGKNKLVYGDCLQVDSSINPGNSGGPLFNMSAEVIGINGRASFKDRGRVNVGHGYAISSRQVHRFLPDLWAAKMARHGTLDAQFTMRGGKITCSAIATDSPAALAGLELGDHLISIQSRHVRNSNVLASVISTLPADWPVELQLQDPEGREKFIHTRLVALDYGQSTPIGAPRVRPSPKKPEGEEGKPNGEQDQPQGKEEASPDGGPGDGPQQDQSQPTQDDESGQSGKQAEDSKKDAASPQTEKAEGQPATEKKQQPGKPTPETQQEKAPQPQPFGLDVPSDVMDPALNRAHAKMLLDSWHAQVAAAAPSKPAGYQLESEIISAGKVIGHQNLVLASDGRFQVETKLGDRVERITFDTSNFSFTAGEERPVSLPASIAITRADTIEAFYLSRMLVRHPKTESAVLEGGDQVAGEIAFRTRYAFTTQHSASVTDKPAGHAPDHSKQADAPEKSEASDQRETDEAARVRDSETKHPVHKLLLWFDWLNPEDPQRIRLVKLGTDKDSPAASPSLVFGPWQELHGRHWPASRRLVTGMFEQELYQLQTVSCQGLDRLPNDFVATATGDRQGNKDDSPNQEGSSKETEAGESP